MRKTFGMNKHQKAVKRVKEGRLAPQELPELLRLSRSFDPEERLAAAELLCPCHVRRRVEEAWASLYLLLEDEDARVRRASWHTLEDGGNPSDPAFLPILERVLRDESDPQVRRFAEHVAKAMKVQEQAKASTITQRASPRRGRCDFCGEADVPVEMDVETLIPVGESERAAWACVRCSQPARRTGSSRR